MFWEMLKVLGIGVGFVGIVMLLIALVVVVMLSIDKANNRNPFL